jgi:hypothetical protein
MPSIPEREKLALNLEEKASNERRKRKDEAMKQFQRFLAPSPSRASAASPSLNDKINGMSPAAKRLLEAKLNVRSSIATPSPGKFATESPARTSAAFTFRSPVVKASSAKQSIENLRSNLKRPSDSLTDNLLKLPKNN